MRARQLLSLHSGIHRLAGSQFLATMHVRGYSNLSMKHPGDEFFEDHIEPKLKQDTGDATQGRVVLPDASSLAFFPDIDQSFEDVVNRELFIVPVIDQLLRRHYLIESHPTRIFFRPESAPLMACTGYSGIGKTTMIGFIMDMFKKISLRGEQRPKVASYLSRFMPSDTVDSFMSRAAGYITIPITFSLYQPWREFEKNPATSIWSRAIENIIFCTNGKKADFYENMCGHRVNATFGMTLLSRIFNQPVKELKVFLLIDDFHYVENEDVRESMLSYVGALMDTYPKTFALVTSKNPSILNPTLSGSYRPVVQCSFTPTPSVLKTLDIWPILEEKPELVPLALDALTYPKGVKTSLNIRHRRDYIVLLKSQIRTRLLGGYYGFSKVFLSGGSFNIESGERFVEIVCDSLPIGALSKANVELFECGLFRNFFLPAYWKDDRLTGKTPALLPVAAQADFATVVLSHPVVKSGGNVAAVWGLLMCLTRPWRAHEGFMMDIMFLFNECRAQKIRRKKITCGLSDPLWSRL